MGAARDHAADTLSERRTLEVAFTLNQHMRKYGAELAAHLAETGAPAQKVAGLRRSIADAFVTLRRRLRCF